LDCGATSKIELCDAYLSHAELLRLLLSSRCAYVSLQWCIAGLVCMPFMRGASANVPVRACGCAVAVWSLSWGLLLLGTS
jgi:hypothetical protein